jgi:hypothetical protein
MYEQKSCRRNFARRHWKAVALIVLGIALAAVAAVAVFLWVSADAQSSGLVPERLSGWSVGTCVTFFLHLLFWEIILVVIPVAVAAIAAYYLWWRQLPAEERAECRRMRMFGKSRGTGSGFSFAINLLVLLKIYLDHNWNTPFSTWTFDYLVSSYLWALAWILIIVGIPLAIGGVWWLSRCSRAS